MYIHYFKKRDRKFEVQNRMNCAIAHVKHILHAPSLFCSHKQIIKIKLLHDYEKYILRTYLLIQNPKFTHPVKLTQK